MKNDTFETVTEFITENKMFETETILTRFIIDSTKDVVGNIIIPDNIKRIGDGAFKDINNVNHIIIPDSVESIGIEAFAKCDTLITINIPSAVKSIGRDAFYGCKRLKSVNIQDNSISDIPYFCFAGCESLESIYIGDGVKVIHNNVFNNTKITSLVLPKSIRVIEPDAFYNSCINKIDIPLEALSKDPSQQSGYLKIQIDATNHHKSDGTYIMRIINRLKDLNFN